MTSAHEFNQAVKGDFKAIEKICSATWEPLYRFIYYKVQNREEAEDITQETYVKTFNYIRKNKAPTINFLGFMKTVSLNLIRDRWRLKKRRGVTVNIEEIKPEEAAGIDQQNSVAERLLLESALGKLKEEQRIIIDLRIIKGCSVQETAKLVGKTEAAVRTAQHRALQALAQLLEEKEEKN